jgi:hypothetical protein
MTHIFQFLVNVNLQNTTASLLNKFILVCMLYVFFVNIINLRERGLV